MNIRRWCLLLLCAHFARAQNIVQAEYYIDADPGMGSGTAVSVSAGPDVDLNFTADLSGVSSGIHILYVRTMDANGVWSQPYARQFLKEKIAGLPNILKAEYYLDADPGYGSGIDIPVGSTPDELLDFGVDLSAVEPGIHIVYVRTLDSDGGWGLTHSRQFLKELIGPAPDMTTAEYYVDTDPGYGNGTQVNITPSQDVNTSFTIDLSGMGLSFGIHVVFVRTRDTDGSWSLSSVRQFVAEQSFENAAITRVEYFVDTDPGYGNGTPVSLAQQPVDGSLGFAVPGNSLSAGMHVLYTRTQDASGLWSHSSNRTVAVDDYAPLDTVNLVSVQYEFRKDSTIASGGIAQFQPTADADVAMNLNVLPLSQDSVYEMHLRFKDTRSKLSQDYIHHFSTKKRGVVGLNVAQVAFGSVKVGTTANLALEITNIGDDTLKITRIFSSSARFGVRDTAYTLSVNQTVVDTVSCSPLALGPLLGLLKFQSNALSGTDSILVTAFGIGTPTIAFNTKTIAFGSVATGGHKDTTFRISNGGNDTLKVTTMTFSDSSFSAVKTNFTIAPGDTTRDSVRFAPSSVRSYAALLIILSNTGVADTISLSGTGTTPTGVLSELLLPEEFALEQNYPNPFNPITMIRYQIPVRSVVTLAVYDVLGRLVKTLAAGEQAPGYYAKEFSTTRAVMASGLYIYRLSAVAVGDAGRTFSQTKKFILLK